MFAPGIQDHRVFVWMYLVIFATTSAVNVFESGNEFRNLVVDKITGELYVGAVNSIYRLNNRLGMIAEKNTKCTPKCDQRSSEDKSANVNQILLIDRSPPAKLLACGNAGGGTCVFLNMSSLSIYGCKLPVPEIVSSRPKYPSVAFMDPVNDLMVVASTNILRRTPSFAHIAAYRRDDSKRCFTRVAGLDLESEENTPLYILGAIVGKFRYLFTVANQGSTVVRLCEHFTNPSRKAIFSYKEMPLNCVGEDGGNFIQLKVARIFQPGRKLAKAFGISVNDSVVVGVFRKSVSSLESAVCVYSFKQINNFFWSNIKDCFSGSRPGIKNWYTKAPCQKETPRNCTDENTRNPTLTGRIPCSANAVVTCGQCNLTASLDVTVYRDETIAFIGTGTGKLAKVVIDSNTSGRMYKLSSRIDQNIVSVGLEPNGTSLYIMGTKKIIKIPVEECSNSTTCKSCVGTGDPYCGWCTLYAKCTTQSQCQDASSVLGYVQNIDQCINITDVYPRELPLSESHQKVKVSISNLPERNVLDPYDCYIGSKNVSSTLVNKTTLVCLAPQSSQLPTPSSETGKTYVELAVYSVETKQKIVSTTVAFYNCTAISSCLKCTTGLLNCSWCHYEAACVGDVRSSCPDSFAPWVSDQSSHQCPFLNSQTVYVPAGIQRKVVVNATQLPEPKISNDYKCIIEIVQQSFAVQAWWNSSTSLTCGPKIYNYSYYEESVLGHLRVELGKSTINHVNKSIPVYLYKCEAAAKLCGGCVVFKKTQYRCGWCSESRSCSVKDACPAQWVEPNGECKDRPAIESFYPKSGPVAGNTKLEINGTEFGRKWEDVREVSIGDVPCNVSKNDYVIAKRIVCYTSSSSKGPFSSKISVIVLGKKGVSNEEFRYQVPEVDDFKPKIGPVSGGTLVNITGKYLDTGRYINASIGGLECKLRDGRRSERQILCDTPSVTTRRRRSVDTVKSGTLVVTFDGFRPERPSKEVFQYVPDPNITDITPEFSFSSSNIPLNVTGTNLYAVYFPQIELQFKNKTFRKPCERPADDHMLCVLPNVSSILTDEDMHVAKISLYLDGVTKWRDLSNYPEFGSIKFFPDPAITPFTEVYVLKGDVLELQGKNLVASGKEDLIQFVITVGGQVCNITSKQKNIIYCTAPKRSSLPELDSYDVLVNVTSSSLVFHVGKLTYDVVNEKKGSINLVIIYGIAGGGGAVLLLFVILMFFLYRRKKKQQRQTERTFEMQINTLESKVAKECKEAFAELQTDMTDFTSDLGGGGIHFFDFKHYAARVLFPGVEEHVVMEEKRAPESPHWEEALRTFSQLIGNKNFLLIFIRTLENQEQFKMQDRCNVASLLIVALQSKMEYCTEILQHLLAELIRKSMSKSHPKLLLRRTECIAEKLLTNWLTFTMSSFIKDKAGKPLFMLYKAIRFQIEKGPVDAITNEARYSLSEDKLLRQSIEYNTLMVTVEFEDNPPVQVEVLDSDTVSQAKDKIMEVLFKNIPYSCRITKDELNLKWVESPSKHRILKDEDSTSVKEGDWKKINTLLHYEIPDGTCLRLVKRFASPFDTSEFHSSLPKIFHSPSTSSNQSIIRRSRTNINDADIRPWHLTKPIEFVQERDDPRHSKLLSEIYLTRLLSTKGILQQYVDDLFDAIFPSFRKNERPPLPIKFLFDFLDQQAEELNITDPEVLRTWKNNSLPLRFWVNLIKNPNFLFDVYKAPIVDSCLTVIAQLLMDACSVSERRLGKDSPSNKLLYAKEIPAYRQKVARFYEDISDSPPLTEVEVENFFSTHYIEDFNVDNALKELYKYAAKYQDELQEALEDSRYPQLASKLEHVVACFSDD